MNCYICGRKFDSLRFMRHHFRLVHNLNQNDTYICTYDNCAKRFSHLFSFNRHVRGHMQICESNDTPVLCANVSHDNSSVIQTLSHTSVPVSVPNDADDFSNFESQEDSNDTYSVVNRNLFNDCQDDFIDRGVDFSLKLHSRNNFTRKDVVQIQNFVMQDIVNPIVSSVKQFIEYNVLPNHRDDIEKRLLLNTFVEEISNPFRTCQNERKLFEWLKKNNYASDFNEFFISQEIGEKFSLGNLSYDDVDVTGVLLPLSFQFQTYFEKDDQLIHTLNDMERIANNTDYNGHFLHGLLWHRKSQPLIEAGKIVLPFFLYIDDAEINNPLGPHANPITFLYYSFPCVKDSEVFLATVIEGHDYKKYGNEKCLRALVQEIQHLEENGITIKTSNGEKTVHFILGLIVGDNLGLNTVLGFTTAFNHTFFCRFCKASKSLTHKMSEIDRNLIRDYSNYDDDVMAEDIKLTGIKEPCLFNSINSFHVTTNFSIDILHDIFEGVCNYNMCHIIKHLIDNKYFSLDSLNDRKHMFNYGSIEIDHISPDITKAHLDSNHLKMTAREMMSFIHLFPLMVGDLVPEDDHVWLFMLTFFEIIEILISSEISCNLVERLKFLIKQHHQNYVRFFGDTLKPKHHFMLHYIEIILQSGPPRFYWTFRYEAKHKEFKAYARSTTSRKNVCVSIAKKYQMKYARFLIDPKKPILSVNSFHGIMHTDYEQLIQSFCDDNGIGFHNFRCYSECIYNSKKYKKDLFISQYIDSNCPENTLIYKIMQIVLFSNCDSIYVICKRINVIRYLKHFSSFVVAIDNTTNQGNFLILSIEKLLGPPINVHKTAQGIYMIKPKQYCF